MLYFTESSKNKQIVFALIIVLTIKITSSSTSPCSQYKPYIEKFHFYFPKVSSTDEQVMEFVQEIWPCSNNTIKLLDIPSDTKFIISQVHSYLYDVTMSYTSPDNANEKVVGTNIGLLQIVDGNSTAQFNVENNHVFKVSIYLASVPYKKNAPLPGGCNMEFEVKVAPFMKINYQEEMIQVDAQPAQIPDANISKFNKPCLPNQLQYETYLLYLPSNDFTNYTYFSGIRKMMTVERIKENGRKVTPPLDRPGLRRVFSAYYGTGALYAMIVSYGNDSSAYVSTHTYACKPEYNFGTCAHYSISSTLTCCLLVFVGLYLCAFGNKDSSRSAMVMCALLVGLVEYVMLMKLENINLSNQECAVISLISGLICGCILISSLRKFEIGILATAHLLDGVVLGILFASVMFYTPFSDLSIFNDNLQYWLCFTLFVLVGLLLVLSCQEKTDNVAPAIVGAYLVVLGVEFVYNSNLTFIIINPIRKATIEGFGSAITSPPYQLMDLIMVVGWIMLAMYGIYSQPNKDFSSNSSEQPSILDACKTGSSNTRGPSYGTFTSPDSNNDNVFFSDNDESVDTVVKPSDKSRVSV